MMCMSVQRVCLVPQYIQRGCPATEVSALNSRTSLQFHVIII